MGDHGFAGVSVPRIQSKLALLLGEGWGEGLA